MNPGHRVEYKTLREVDPVPARLAVLEYLKTTDHSTSDAALQCGTVDRVSIFINRIPLEELPGQR